MSYSLPPFPRAPFLSTGACLSHAPVNGRHLGVQVGSQRRLTQRVATTARSILGLGEPAPSTRKAFLSVACVPGHTGSGHCHHLGQRPASTTARSLASGTRMPCARRGCALHWMASSLAYRDTCLSAVLLHVVPIDPRTDTATPTHSLTPIRTHPPARTL